MRLVFAKKWLSRLSRPTCPISRPPRPSVRPRLELLEERFLPTAYVVNTTNDILGDNSGTQLTLRDALTAINTQTPSGNARAGTVTNTITFAIGTTGSVQEIGVGSGNVAAALPPIRFEVQILGFSQGGTGYNGPPLIVLNGGSAGTGAGANGLDFEAGSAGSEVQGLVIQKFSNDGILLKGTSGNLIVGNFIGTDSHGTAKLGNGVGVDLETNATANTVGGTAAGDANVISGNSVDGIYLSGRGASGNVVLGNRIGTNVHGTAELGNTKIGVVIQSGATANILGGSAAGAGNVISGNGAVGVELDGSGTSGNMVLGNKIGTNITGTAKLGNNIGVSIMTGASANTVGGTVAGAANLLSANDIDDVEIAGSGTSGNVVLGNLIGTDKSGTAKLGNSFNGVAISGGATANIVGGTATGAANVIAGNKRGVYLYGSGTSGNVVLGNRIGTDRSGTAKLGNVGDGVRLQTGASNNTVGGVAAGSGNTIAFNAKGVVVGENKSDTTTVRDSILGNSIFDNAGLGIDLGNDGPTPNGKNPRAFPNDGQNAPVLTSVSTTSVSGKLASQPDHTYRLEFFASSLKGPPLQGQTFLGALERMTNGQGQLTFTMPVTITSAEVVTVTATDETPSSKYFGDTSEFSQIATVTRVTSSPTINENFSDQVVTLTAQVTSNKLPVATGEVTFSVAGLPGSVTVGVNAQGQATASFTVPGQTQAGQYTIIAVYQGHRFAASSSDPLADGTLTVLGNLRYG